MKAGLQRLPHGERFHCSVGPGKRGIGNVES
jgi:hypothetical protein